MAFSNILTFGFWTFFYF